MNIEHSLQLKTKFYLKWVFSLLFWTGKFNDSIQPMHLTVSTLYSIKSHVLFLHTLKQNKTKNGDKVIVKTVSFRQFSNSTDISIKRIEFIDDILALALLPLENQFWISHRQQQ